VLFSQRPSTTSTRLWPATTVVPGAPHVALRHGMFLVRNGRDSFYSPAWTSARYRCDAGCMTPCDARAAEVVRYFEWLLAHAAVYEWVRESQVFMIDNRKVLHARSAVAPDDMDSELVRVAFRSEGVQ
jgi:hypothetical protein